MDFETGDKNLRLAWKQQISAKMFRNVQAGFGGYQNALRAANATYDAATQTIRLPNGAIIAGIFFAVGIFVILLDVLS